MGPLKLRSYLCIAIVLIAIGFAFDAQAQPEITTLAPVGDYHVHLLSPVTAKMAQEPPLPAIEVPADIARLLGAMEKGWNDKDALAALYTENSVLLNLDNSDRPTWIVGRSAV